MYTVLVDFDDTLADFDSAEKEAFFTSMEKAGIPCTGEDYQKFHRINLKLWELRDLGKMTRTEVYEERFREFLEYKKIGENEKSIWNAASLNRDFLYELSKQVSCVDEAVETLRDFQDQVEFYVISNGTFVVQKNRINHSAYKDLIKGLFVSDVVGSEKPERDFFQKTEILLGGKKPLLLIGDSLRTDIAGGNEMGYATCWYNPLGLFNESTVEPSYEVRTWKEIRELLYGLVTHENRN